MARAAKIRCFNRSLQILFVLAWTHTAWGATYYVAPNGNDNNSGTFLESPFRTIQKAVSRAVAGDTVLVRGGTYREQVEMNAAGTADKVITVAAYGQEVPVIKGSEVVTGWAPHGGAIWKKSGWPHNSQQVFVDFDATGNGSLQQIGMPSQYYTTSEYNKPVGSGVASMTPGTFYYDAPAMTLYVWLRDSSDPNAHVVEASVRRRLLFMHHPFIRLKGFAFRHSNSSAFAKQGAAVELSANSVIEGCDIQHVDFTGLAMGYLKTNSEARNCNISNNGNSGVSAVGSVDFRLLNVTLNRNNTRNFNPLWHAGGFKGTAKTHGTIEKSEVGHNNGSGIWFDHSNSDRQIVIRGNYIHDNGPVDSAIFFEVSNNGLIYNNVLVNNRRRGIYVAASNGTLVYNNTIVATGDRAAIEVGGMPRSSATLMNNAVYNNIVSHGTSLYDIYIMPANGTTIAGNTSDYNDFYRTSGSIKLWSGSTYTDLPTWSSATRFDDHSLDANPAFVEATSPPSALNYDVTASSPVVDAGASLSAVTYDYSNTPRPSGNAFDIGAFEKLASAGSAPDTVPPAVTITSGVGVIDKKGTVTLSASATDNVSVTGMRLYLDGALKATSSGGQISYRWKASAGSHEVRVTATDSAQNTGFTSATLTVR